MDLLRPYADAAIALAQHVVARFRAGVFDESLSSELKAHFEAAARRVRNKRCLSFEPYVFQTELPRIYAARSACVVLHGGIPQGSTLRHEALMLTMTVDFVSDYLMGWIREHVWPRATPAHRRLIYRHVFTKDATPARVGPDDGTSSALNAQTLHRYLDALQFAERLGEFHRHEDLACSVRGRIYNDTLTLLDEDLTASALTVPLNECLPNGLELIPGGTLLQKLRRLCALANAEPVNGGPISPRLRDELRLALQRLETRLRPLDPDRARAVMLAAARRPEGGARNLVAALDPDLLRHVVSGLMLKNH